jgi:ArsR family metal-binding transcriptional regulator
MKLKEGTVKLSEHVKKFLKDKTEITEKHEERIRDLSQAKPVEITEIRKLMPCTADPSMSRIIADMTPPLGEALKILEPLFPRSRYLDKKRSLMIQKEESIITIYSSGKVIVGMVKNEIQAKEVLEEIKITINGAIKRGVAPSPGEKIRAEFKEIYKYLPQTNCGNCSEKDCYSFAVRLMAGEITLDKCIMLKEAKYAANQEHLQVLTAYI